MHDFRLLAFASTSKLWATPYRGCRSKSAVSKEIWMRKLDQMGVLYSFFHLPIHECDVRYAMPCVMPAEPFSARRRSPAGEASVGDLLLAWFSYIR